jgi:shikimate dehydrogenase
MEASTPAQGTAAGQAGAIRRLGLIGHPVAHSRSPAMQQAALDALGIPARYELWDTTPEQLAARVASLRGPEALGANVTIPYKSAVVPLLDAIAAEARRAAGVVNTIVREETQSRVRLVGHNTDVLALSRILAEEARWGSAHGEARRVLVLGAGGAARAAIGAAQELGAAVYVAARRIEAALEALEDCWRREHEAHEELDTHTTVGRQDVPPLPPAWRARALALDDTARLAEALRGADVLFQATSVGMGVAEGSDKGVAESPIALELLASLPAHAYVFDLVYAPPRTPLVRTALALGLRATGGLPMLLYQGAAAFTLWTGCPAPLDAMRAALGL